MDPTIRDRLSQVYLSPSPAPSSPEPMSNAVESPPGLPFFRLAVPAALMAGLILAWAVGRTRPNPSPTALSPVDHPGLVQRFDDPRAGAWLGRMFGAWERDPNDETQGCRLTLESVPFEDRQRTALRVWYDVDSTQPASNGVWFRLNGLDLTSYQALDIQIKGDAQAGFTRLVKLELKTPSGTGVTYLTDITDQWQWRRIPLDQFRGLRSRQDVTELVLVFEDRAATDKTGVLYLAEAHFSP